VFRKVEEGPYLLPGVEAKGLWLQRYPTTLWGKVLAEKKGRRYAVLPTKGNQKGPEWKTCKRDQRPDTRCVCVKGNDAANYNYAQQVNPVRGAKKK